MVLVFYFGFGQSCAAIAAPINGLFATHNAITFHESAQFAGSGCLVFRLHGHVRVVPDAEYAQTFEFLALGVQPLGGVRSTNFADGQRVEFFILFLEFLFNFVLNGQTMTIPAGNVLSFLSLHVSGFDDDVLENLVQSGPHVNVAVGIGRTIMQNILIVCVTGSNHSVVRFVLFPELEHLRLALLEVGLHGKFGLRQEQGFLIVAHGFRFLQEPYISIDESLCLNESA